jgi:hypothetical protein
MEAHRRLLSYVAILIATIFYIFRPAEAASPDLPTVSEKPCEQASQGSSAGRMVACKPGGSR